MRENDSRKTEGKNRKSSKRHVSSSSSSSDEGSSGSSSSESEKDSKVQIKKQKVGSSVTKKQRRREKKREEKKKKKKELNKISKDDFYTKSSEFRLWLVEEKNKYFDQLSGAKSKSYFKRFVKKWNSGKLATKFYRGIDHEDARVSLTKYKWKFAENLTPTRKLGIAKYADRHNTIRSGEHMTPVADGLLKPRTFSTFGKSSSSTESTDESSVFIGPSMGPSQPIQGPARPIQGPMLPGSTRLQARQEEMDEKTKHQLKGERKEFRKHNDMVMEELVPKATGHDAKVEKRIARSEQRKRRGDSPETRASLLYGGRSDIQSQLDAHKLRKEKRRERLEDQATSKVEQYRAKERAKMAALLEQARATKSENALW